jgi:hypothetical protein
MLAACGSSTSGYLSASQKATLSGHLDAISADVQAGQCRKARAESNALNSAVAGLPSSVSSTLLHNLGHGASTIKTLTAHCGAGNVTTTSASTTATTVTETTSTATITHTATTPPATTTQSTTAFFGNTGNTGNTGTGNTGSGSTGDTGTGNTGNTGNTGSGNTGNGGAGIGSGGGQ